MKLPSLFVRCNKYGNYTSPGQIAGVGFDEIDAGAATFNRGIITEVYMSAEYEAMSVEKWVNLEDIADHLSVSTDTVRNWIKDGKLPYYRAGKRYKFRISEVDEWLKDGKISE